MLRSKLLSGLGAGALVLLAAACGSSSSGSGGGSTNVSCTPGGTTVCLQADPTTEGKYNPTEATVKSGGSVTWIFTDDTAQHTVTFDDNSFDSGAQSAGYTTTQTVSKPAGTTISYHCTLHAQMVGKITVN
jgi:plastocyanin